MTKSHPLSSHSLARQHIRRRRWFSQLVPTGSDMQSQNVRHVLTDAIGVGVGNAAHPFVAVLMTRLGASNLAVGLFTALPALSGLIFGIPLGRYLQSQLQIVKHFAVARFLLLSSYGLTGVVPLLFSAYPVEIILGIWLFATIPQTIVNICFTIVMAGVAGPDGRYYLMSRRWSILGMTTAVMIALAGLALDRLVFPINYGIVLPFLSLGGMVSFYFTSRIVLPDQVAPSRADARPWHPRLIADGLSEVRAQSSFVRQTVGAFLFRLGFALAMPLYPLFYVHSLNATDAEIGWINTMQGVVLVVAYFFWARISRRRGNRFALLTTTLGLALHPLLLALVPSIPAAIVLAALAGVFQAGVDLVFFDTLVASLPKESSATFVGIYQTASNVALFAGPLVGTLLANIITISGALGISALIRALGFVAFFILYRAEPDEIA